MRKYTMPIITTVALLIIIIVIFSLAVPNEAGFTTIIPINSMSVQAISIFVLLSISSIVGVLLGLLLGPFLLLLHSKVVGRKRTYTVQEKPRLVGFRGYRRAFFPALMAIDFSMHFAGLTVVRDMLLDPVWFGSDSGITSWPFVTLILLLIPCIAISMALFSAVWIILETGLVYKTRDETSESSEPIETRSAGGWYMSIFRGYAGFGAIFGFYTFAMASLSLGGVHWSVPLILIPMPLILMVMAAPGLVIFDFLQERRLENNRKLAQKYVK